jgi:hypothetical protein
MLHTPTWIAAVLPACAGEDNGSTFVHDRGRMGRPRQYGRCGANAQVLFVNALAPGAGWP